MGCGPPKQLILTESDLRRMSKRSVLDIQYRMMENCAYYMEYGESCSECPACEVGWLLDIVLREKDAEEATKGSFLRQLLRRLRRGKVQSVLIG